MKPESCQQIFEKY